VGRSGRVLALDILPMEPIEGIEFIEGDFTAQPVLDLLMERLSGRTVDLVISDMAPNMTGVASVDQARSVNLAELALEFSDKTLKPGGCLVIKTFQGGGFNEFYAQLRRRCTKLVTRKPSASRAESREIYLLGKGFKGA
ncbi:MAG: RlmE family RNA methyltransferase, partial [Sulfuricaulis sp.]